MGEYIKKVEAEGANPKIVGTRRQIKDLHRNPLMHPDAVLSEPDAIVLLGVVTSAITAMIEDMKATGLTSAPFS